MNTQSPDTSNSPARITGVVRSFMPEKGFGFINGDDGKSYFVHVKAVAGGSLNDGQQVTFEGEPTPKGYRALKVEPGALPPPPTDVLSPPDNFIWTQGQLPRGMEVIFWISQNLWAESNDPHAARNLLTQNAKALGANAVVNVRLEKFSRQAGCSNYFYTVHRFYGDAACVMRVRQSTDPKVIAESEAWYEDMSGWLARKAANPPVEDTVLSRMVPPGTFKMIGTLALSWTLTLSKIIYLGVKVLLTQSRK